jgi:predicted phosphoribosyltransferase
MPREAPQYQDRAEAGRVLAGLLLHYKQADPVVLAVPNGGVAVAGPVAEALGAPLHLLVVRKIQIPGNTEAGFGAVSADGTAVIDERMVRGLGLSPRQVEAQRAEALKSVHDRLARYGGAATPPSLKDRTVIIVDDGLASGATMEAAAAIVRKSNPAALAIAAPTGSERAVLRLGPLADELVCPHVGRGPVFAVANAYRKWYDVEDAEVLALLARRV